MNAKVLKTLEYDKILAMLSGKCQTPLGHAEAEALLPSDDPFEIEKGQHETRDALSRLYSFGNLSCSGARDIRDSLLRLRIQANLGISELLSINVLLKAALRVKSYGTRNEAADREDSLKSYFDALSPLISVQHEIDRCIISEEEIADDASSALRSIRRKLMQAAQKVRSELNALLISNSGYLRENVITMRNGRYCVPVRTEYRSMVPGMVHDESGSGSTVFIEPMSVVRLNNEIRELEIEEQKEIEVILANLSALAAEHTGELETNLKVLSHLDFVFAKAALAREMDAAEPVFNDRRAIVIKSGRHPLLDRKTVVPIDLDLGDRFHQLVVTGPNTGGKTVSLKTVGLFQLMGQAGLHIPAFEGSQLGIFREVYADIGDEQSIEQSLSTFSSHMVQIVKIVEEADRDSLVLLDELCSGTDPQEGAALAISILSFLRKLEIRSIATTHYSELKLYALSTEGVSNASCEFDIATLSPTYRLLIGIPGRSNAFAISKKLGLPAHLIEDARQHIDSDSERFEDVIRNLDRSRKTIEHEKLEIRALREEARKLRDSLDKQEAQLSARRDKIIGEAQQEARKMLLAAKEQVDRAIRDLNRAGSGSEAAKALEKTRAETRALIEKNTDRTEPVPEKKSVTSAKDLHIGDGVLVLSMNLKGTVSSLPDAKGNLFVQMGILKTQVKLSDVELLHEDTISLDGKPAGSAIRSSSIGMSKAATISPEINLIGKTVDEAIPELEKYLDDASLSHLEKVRIVHGRGTGALKNAVHAKLKKLSYIKEFRLGEYGEGDSGVTIATFK